MAAQTSVKIAGATIFLLGVTAGTSALAGANDLRLSNLCPTVTVNGNAECRWVTRDTGGITGVAIDLDGKTKFRSVMSELGILMAPRMPMPANTLGFAGVRVSGDINLTSIHASRSYWNAAKAVSPDNPSASRPDATQATVGMFLHKGFWLPVPTFELGGGFVNLLGSQLLSWQGYVKVALHEGFHDWPIPSLALRAAVGYLTGTDQVTATTTTFDVLVSKGFGFFKTVRLEPYGGWSLISIVAKSRTIDFTPACDSRAYQTNQGPDASCVAGDALASAAFPHQDAITRHRLVGGMKLKFGVLAVVAEYAFHPPGTSRDGREPNGAKDQSGSQHACNLSTGLQF